MAALHSLVSLLLVFTLVQWITGISIQNMNGVEKVPNQYIIKLNTAEWDFKNPTLLEQKIESMRSELSRAVTNFKVVKKYDFGKIIFLLVEGEIETSVAYMLDVPEIANMEANMVVRASQDCERQTFAGWSLSRISSREKTFLNTYEYLEADGENMYAYVLDSGIYIEHNDFGGRAEHGFVDEDVDNGRHGDENGHGTHCTGTIIGSTYGVAKRARAIAVKVLGSGGTGSISGIVEGLQWVLNDFQARGNDFKAVVSMSLGSGFSTSLNDATQEVINAGLPVVVAAGNEDQDACLVSPATVSDAITVGASDSSDDLADYSNHGSCVDIIAPGSSVVSAYIGSTSRSATLSGTSMATSHVAGALLRHLSQVQGKRTPAELKKWLLDLTSANLIDIRSTATPNKLLYAPCNVSEALYDSAISSYGNWFLIVISGSFLLIPGMLTLTGKMSDSELDAENGAADDPDKMYKLILQIKKELKDLKKTATKKNDLKQIEDNIVDKISSKLDATCQKSDAVASL